MQDLVKSYTYKEWGDFTCLPKFFIKLTGEVIRYGVGYKSIGMKNISWAELPTIAPYIQMNKAHNIEYVTVWLSRCPTLELLFLASSPDWHTKSAIQCITITEKIVSRLNI